MNRILHGIISLPLFLATDPRQAFTHASPSSALTDHVLKDQRSCVRGRSQEPYFPLLWSLKQGLMSIIFTQPSGLDGELGFRFIHEPCRIGGFRASFA
jgi:hypothetical protein